MRTVALILAILLIPAAAAAPIQLELPSNVNFDTGFVMSGHIDGLPDLTNPLFLEPSNVLFAEGVLTVCPASRGTDIVETVTALAGECEGEEVFENPTFEFGLGTQLQMVGNYEQSESQGAVIAMTDQSARWMVVLSESFTLTDGAGFSFAPLNSRSSITVTDEEQSMTFNRDGWAFFHEATEAEWTIGGYANQGKAGTITVTPAPREDFVALGDPYLLLDLQEALLGSDNRDRRALAAETLNAFGRVPALINGAVYGNLVGSFGDLEVGEENRTLVRVSSATLSQSGGHLEGDGEFTIYVGDDGISTGGIKWNAIWFVAIIAWVVALASMALRRRPILRNRWHRWGIRGGALVAFIVMDLGVFLRLTGSSSILAVFRFAPLPVMFDMIGIVALTTLVMWVALLLPGRIFVNKWVPRKVAWIGDVAVAAVFIVLMLLVPALFLSMSYDFMRF